MVCSVTFVKWVWKKEDHLVFVGEGDDMEVSEQLSEREKTVCLQKIA